MRANRAVGRVPTTALVVLQFFARANELIPFLDGATRREMTECRLMRIRTATRLDPAGKAMLLVAMENRAKAKVPLLNTKLWNRLQACPSFLLMYRDEDSGSVILHCGQVFRLGDVLRQGKPGNWEPMSLKVAERELTNLPRLKPTVDPRDAFPVAYKPQPAPRQGLGTRLPSPAAPAAELPSPATPKPTPRGVPVVEPSPAAPAAELPSPATPKPTPRGVPVVEPSPAAPAAELPSRRTPKPAPRGVPVAEPSPAAPAAELPSRRTPKPAPRGVPVAEPSSAAPRGVPSGKLPPQIPTPKQIAIVEDLERYDPKTMREFDLVLHVAHLKKCGSWVDSIHRRRQMLAEQLSPDQKAEYALVHMLDNIPKDPRCPYLSEGLQRLSKAYPDVLIALERFCKGVGDKSLLELITKATAPTMSDA